MSPTSYRAAPSRVNIKEDVGFEPTHAFTRLTVFKTVPFSQTWVILQIINQYQYLALGAGPPRFQYNRLHFNLNEIVVGDTIVLYLGQFLQHRYASLAGLGANLFTDRY